MFTTRTALKDIMVVPNAANSPLKVGTALLTLLDDQGTYDEDEDQTLKSKVEASFA